MTKTIDFDAFRAEQKAEPISLKIGGKEYSLPPGLPATMALDVIRANAENPDADVPPEQLQGMGAALFGGDEVFIGVLKEHNITMDELPALMRMVIEAYGTPAEESVPNRAARRTRATKTST